MKKPILQACVAAALAFTTWAALAQSGEADPSGCRASPSKSASAKERAEARANRTAEGTAVARTARTDDEPSAMGSARSASPQERKDAKASRRAATSDALRKGEITSGESATK